MAKEKKYVDVPLHKLKPHPRNDKLYAPRTDKEIDDLAAQMDTNGLTEPIEITTANDIIAGHGRVAAAKKLGWKTIRCWVRDDLETPDVVEKRLIESNLHRRHLSRLDLVRSYRELKRLEKDRKGKRLSDDKVRGDLRDIIAKRFQPPVSGKTLERWEKVLDMPMPIQQAVEHGEMKLTDAVKLAGLDAKIKEKFAKELAEGRPVCAVLARHLGQASSMNGSDAELAADVAASRALDRLLKALVKGVEDLGPKVNDLRRIGDGSVMVQLMEGKRLIVATIARIEQNEKRHAKAMEEEE